MLRNDKEFKLSYQPDKDSYINFKFTVDFKADLFNFLAVLNEVELYKKWMPFCQESRTVRANTNQKDPESPWLMFVIG